MTQSIQLSHPALSRLPVAASPRHHAGVDPMTAPDRVVDMRAAMAPAVDRQAAPVRAGQPRAAGAVPVDRSPPPLPPQPASAPRTSRLTCKLASQIIVPLVFGVGFGVMAGYLGKDKTDAYGDTVSSPGLFAKWFFIIGGSITGLGWGIAYATRNCSERTPNATEDYNTNLYLGATRAINARIAMYGN